MIFKESQRPADPTSPAGDVAGKKCIKGITHPHAPNCLIVSYIVKKLK